MLVCYDNYSSTNREKAEAKHKFTHFTEQWKNDMKQLDRPDCLAEG